MGRADRMVSALLIMTLGLPLLWAAWAAAMAALDASAWQGLLADSQTLQALGLTLWTGLLASGLSVALAAWLMSHNFPGPAWARLVQALGPMLAVPHAAFAIGLAFLLAPSGWLLRALSPWATGLDAPPPWATTQDPWGLGLVLVLIAKEVPFLLWAAATQLQRADVAQVWTRELLVARSMGYGPRAAWWRVLWPQLWPRLRWPMLAVLAYSLTVVDVALVIGPTTPPTLAVLAWQWLLDADVTVNARGAAAAWLLALLVGAMAGLLWQVPRQPAWRTRWTTGARHAPAHLSMLARAGVVGLAALLCLYLAVMLSLAVGSVAGIWSFPAFWPQTLTTSAWASVWGSLATMGTTLTLALGSALVALLWSVAWLECAPALLIDRLRRLIYLPLVLPPVLWVVGVHGLTLNWGIDATWAGLWLAHTLAAVPYVLIALSPAYTGFDPRFRHVAASLGHGRAVFLWRVKWPLLRAALASAFAVGFAVSVAQYLPTLFVGAGRFATVTTEAVTLASGAQRSLTAAYAWLQWLLPALVFGLAAWLGKPRRY
ncbi:ABC transporter permease [Rhodoferax sp.]|uniref:ABC transporter permease n=1 Tax=Rhodoferax sp. TaxID=50421 RepID=UPI0027267D63|nr:ABC transporter permease [Rhodoferax sp.]MDO9196044.1 ABC transporter permease [Rhodoferax sp.]